MQKLIIFTLLASIALSSCKAPKTENKPDMNKDYPAGSFGHDLDFLNKYQKTVVLERDDAMVALVPAYQGRVMTSSSAGMGGMSYGWINYKLIEAGHKVAHFNNYGGEERLWLGPEGGQFSIYFAPGVPFTFENWQVPAPIDSDSFDLISANDTLAVFQKNIELLNYTNTKFPLRVDRSVNLLTAGQVSQRTGLTIPPAVKTVAYETTNEIRNTGKTAWNQQEGLLSIWMLGQLISSPTNIVMVPFIEGPEEQLGPVVNDNYFGKVSADRLKILKNLILFKADGLQRGKIGLTPKRAKNLLGSYDYDKNVLTLLFYNKPDEYEGYVNSMWQIQEKPFAGDVINSYNDGPLEDGSQLGPFYELEASSPAKSLKPGESLRHVNLTLHLSGSPAEMDTMLKALFGVTIEEIKSAFAQ
ncbi:MAG: hypothetical protein A2X22_07545 [Bacteroidetes bacterium GWF2_49_14]|nr:MAG: hypothetical protein A2X22_07545 [Bacteroidetes bacterium GWF2_49_14]